MNSTDAQTKNGAPKAKQAKLDTSEMKNGTSNLDVSATQSALEEIDSCQNDIDALNEKASEEVLSIEKKYNKLRAPHYARRAELIQKIPHFWCTTFKNQPEIGRILKPEDEICLQSLSQVEVVQFEDIKSGYKLVFTFSDNPFFTNKVLEKEFQIASVEHTSTSTPIKWKEGKNLITKKEKQINGKKRKADDEPENPNGSGFFTWFANNEDAMLDDIAEVIKDDVWQYPLNYFLEMGNAENGMSDEDDEDEEDLDDSVLDVGSSEEDEENDPGVYNGEDDDEEEEDEEDEDEEDDED